MDDDLVANLLERVQRLEDHLAVLKLMNSWGPAVDVGLPDAAAGLWTDDAVLDSDMAIQHGPPDVATMVVSDGQQQLIRDGCAHVQGFPVLHVDGDKATATGYSRVYRYIDGAHELWRVSANHWEFRRTPDGWRVERRTNRVINGSPPARDVLSRAFPGSKS